MLVFGDILAGILSWREAGREGGVCIFGYLQRRLPSAGEGRAWGEILGRLVLERYFFGREEKQARGLRERKERIQFWESSTWRGKLLQGRVFSFFFREWGLASLRGSLGEENKRKRIRKSVYPHFLSPGMISICFTLPVLNCSPLVFVVCGFLLTLEDYLCIYLFWNALSIDPLLLLIFGDHAHVSFWFHLYPSHWHLWNGVRLNSLPFFIHALFSPHIFCLVFFGILSITFGLVIWVEVLLGKLRSVS